MDDICLCEGYPLDLEYCKTCLRYIGAQKDKPENYSTYVSTPPYYGGTCGMKYEL